VLLALLLIVIIFLTKTSSLLALDSPVLISPSNGVTISSAPTLTWQSVTGSTQYKIIVDDEPSITSPYAKDPYYTTNTQYSPQSLLQQTYYWKVAAKDSATDWQWGSTWSFTISSTTPTSSTSPTSSPSPTTSSSFTISNIPSQINSDQTMNVTVSLSLHGNPNTLFYLKGAFKKTEAANYFGLTKVGPAWVKNGSSYSDQLSITTNSSGAWSGNLEVEVDPFDSGYQGSGDYIFKIGRYTNNGSGPTWSNEVSVKITAKEVSGGDLDEINSIFHKTSTKESPVPTKKTSVTSSNYEAKENPAASVAAANISPTPTPTFKVAGEKQSIVLPLLGAGLIFAGKISIIFIYLHSKKIDDNLYY